MRRDAPAGQPRLGYSAVFASHKRPKRRHGPGAATAGKVTHSSSSSSSPLGRERSSSGSSFFLLRPVILARGLKQRQLARIYVFEDTDGWILMADGWERLVRKKRRREGRRRGRGFSGVVEGQRLGAQAKWYVPSRQRLRETRAAKSRRGGEEGAAAEVLLRRDGESGELQQLLAPGRGTLDCAVRDIGESWHLRQPGSHAAAAALRWALGTGHWAHAAQGRLGSWCDAARLRMGSLTARWSGPCLQPRIISGRSKWPTTEEARTVSTTSHGNSELLGSARRPGRARHRRALAPGITWEAGAASDTGPTMCRTPTRCVEIQTRASSGIVG